MDLETVLEARQKWKDGLITLGDYLAVLNLFLDEQAELLL